ncbi:hypothetical protein FIBSPDRAFT_879156, partial [Athelia psychrophila]
MRTSHPDCQLTLTFSLPSPRSKATLDRSCRIPFAKTPACVERRGPIASPSEHAHRSTYSQSCITLYTGRRDSRTPAPVPMRPRPLL